MKNLNFVNYEIRDQLGMSYKWKYCSCVKHSIAYGDIRFVIYLNDNQYLHCYYEWWEIIIPLVYLDDNNHRNYATKNYVYSQLKNRLP